MARDGIVHTVVANSPATPAPDVLIACARWTITSGNTTATVDLVDAPRIDRVTTLATATATRTVVEGGTEADSAAHTATAYLGDHVVFVTVVTDPGSPCRSCRRVSQANSSPRPWRRYGDEASGLDTLPGCKSAEDAVRRFGCRRHRRLLVRRLDQPAGRHRQGVRREVHIRLRVPRGHCRSDGYRSEAVVTAKAPGGSHVRAARLCAVRGWFDAPARAAGKHGRSGCRGERATASS